MHIGLNLLHAHPGIGGGWNYIKSIVQSLQLSDHENTYTFYCNPLSKCLIKEQNKSNLVCVDFKGTNRIARIVYENSFLQLRMKFDNIDVLHWFANTRSIYSSKPSIVTVHDLLAFNSNQSYSLSRSIYAQVMIPFSLRKANVIVPVSETTKKEISKRFGINSEKMVVVSNIVDDTFRPAESKNLDKLNYKYRLPDKYWLYVAHYYPHKNHENLFRAYALLKSTKQTTWSLVLCGSKNGADKIISEKLKNLGIEKDVIWLPRIDDNEMPTLYSAATALVFPSLFEGGGIPIMEALSCGCPVIASDLPTTKEFAGDNSILYFNGEDVDDIANAMRQFENNDDVIRTYRMHGLEKSNDFRKSIIIPRLLKAYNMAYSNKKV